MIPLIPKREGKVILYQIFYKNITLIMSDNIFIVFVPDSEPLYYC